MMNITSLKLEFLTNNIIQNLNKNGMYTLLDFLQADTEKLLTLTKLSLPQILNVRNEIFAKYSAPLKNGANLFIQNLLEKEFITTGINSLDNILKGGLPIGYLTEFCGLAGSGKTQLCHQLAINCVKENDITILYVDTKGDFSAVRIQKILENRGFSPKEMAMFMCKIKVVRVWTMDEILELLKKLKNKVTIIDKLSLIIIDSLPSLMFQYLGDDSKIGLTLLNVMVNYCRFLCKEFHVSIICVNLQTRWIDEDIISDLEEDATDPSIAVVKGPSYVEKINRCLGKYWQYIPPLVLCLEKREGSNNDISSSNVQINIMKCNYIQNNNVTCILTINSLGVIE